MRWFIQRIRIAIILFVVLVTMAARSEDVGFNRVIQPIFAEHCYACHGPGSTQTETDFRLDVADSVQTVVDPKDPESSELLARLSSADPEYRMPPPPSEALSAESVKSVAEWIAAGAPFESHWAFRPIVDRDPPLVTSERSLTGIDRFIVARLREHGIDLSPRASKQQLIRRATFDLTGLPPTWAEVTAFLNDDSSNAFEKVIDRLLDSPAYGERWGRHWLDIARYADTHGGAAIGFTRFPFSYTYRDYVIAAFNADLPYDRFVKEQIAADQLDLAENSPSLAALGFLTVGMQFRNYHDTIDDQIDVVCRGLLGLTVTCARCHDHKFDPITTADYYSLHAVFAASEPPEELPIIGDPPKTETLAEYQQQLSSLKNLSHDMARDQSEVMRSRLRMQVGLYLRELVKGAPEQDLSTANIFSYRTDDLRPHVVERWRKYLDDMPDDDAVFGPWVRLSRLTKNGFLEQSKRLIGELEEANGKYSTDFHRLSAKPPRWNPRVLQTLREAQATSMLEVADAYGKLFAQVHREWLQALLDASLEAVPGTSPVPDEDARHAVINSSVNQQLRRHLYGPETPTNVPIELASRLLNRPVNDNLNGRRGAIHDLHLLSAGSPPRAMVLREKKMPPPAFVFRRGNPLDRGQAVVPRFLSVLGGSDERPFPNSKRRLALADAIVDPQNPLTRRVIVNWVWKHHFGKGLIRTPDDLGSRGEQPTHPHLLDFLASRLLDDNWSLKKLHRRIMLSEVYQQASRERPACRNVDPENRLFWRMPRQRLEIEAMRDAMLSASGELLRPDRGGRPFELLSDPVTPRRTVYGFVNRDIVHSLFSTFDGANPNACTAKRPETTVPQQTLFALNSEFIQDRAAALIATVFAEQHGEDNTEQIIRQLYRRTLSRDPSREEIDVAIRFVQNVESAGRVENRWRQLAHVLLAANEFVYLD